MHCQNGKRYASSYFNSSWPLDLETLNVKEVTMEKIYQLLYLALLVLDFGCKLINFINNRPTGSAKH